jgi:ribulose-5-phosphate 4-epimerase/fuculose-1-phosphate aldolase
MREPDLRKRRAKAYALLARAGFDPGTAGQASAAWLQAAATAPMDDEADQPPDP